METIICTDCDMERERSDESRSCLSCEQWIGECCALICPFCDGACCGKCVFDDCCELSAPGGAS